MKLRGRAADAACNRERPMRRLRNFGRSSRSARGRLLLNFRQAALPRPTAPQVYVYFNAPLFDFHTLSEKENVHP